MKKGSKILMVEDELHFAELCKGSLEERGFSVLIAPDGREGLERFEKERPGRG